MVSILKRMRKVKALLDIRVGLGAAILPSPSSASQIPPVTRLHLSYARKMYEGHHGARKFWRACLPRLKYHNPAIPMTVQQIDDQSGPALLTIYFANTAGGDSSSAPGHTIDTLAPAPTASERTLTIDIKNRELTQIWARFKELTGAQELAVSEADRQEIEDTKRDKENSDIDRKRVAGIQQSKKDQERMLQAAKADVEKLRAE